MHFLTRWITEPEFQHKLWLKFNSRKFWTIYSNAKKNLQKHQKLRSRTFFFFLIFFFLIHCYLICSSNPTYTEAFVFEKISTLLVRKKLEFSLWLYWKKNIFLIYLFFLMLVYNSLRSSQKDKVTFAEVNPLPALKRLILSPLLPTCSDAALGTSPPPWVPPTQPRRCRRTHSPPSGKTKPQDLESVQKRCNFWLPAPRLVPPRLDLQAGPVPHRPSSSPPSLPPLALCLCASPAEPQVCLSQTGAASTQTRRLSPSLPPGGLLPPSAIPPGTAEKGFLLTRHTGKGIKW